MTRLALGDGCEASRGSLQRPAATPTPAPLQPIERTADAEAAVVQHVDWIILVLAFFDPSARGPCECRDRRQLQLPIPHTHPTRQLRTDRIIAEPRRVPPAHRTLHAQLREKARVRDSGEHAPPRRGRDAARSDLCYWRGGFAALKPRPRARHRTHACPAAKPWPTSSVARKRRTSGHDEPRRVAAGQPASRPLRDIGRDLATTPNRISIEVRSLFDAVSQPHVCGPTLHSI